MKRKLWLVAVLVLCLVFAVGILAACNESGGSGQQTPGGEDPGTETPGDNPGGEDPGDETVSFTVTFDTQGGSALADITVENGQVIGEFTLPTKQCSRLVGFALDTAGEQMWNVLTDTVSANITLYAIWEDAHTWGEWADTTPATCTENGERTRECEVCGVTESEVIPASHIWGEWTETIAPGCETEGERSHSCEVCGKTENEAIDALGHDYSEEYTEDVAPTCENPGSESRHCTRCDATTDSRDIAPLGHDYEGAKWHHNNANHWRYCNRCGEESERENHIFDDSGVCECGMIEIAPVREFRFISLGNNTWRLANYTGNRTNVSIPSTYNNGTVVAISDDAFSGNTAMETLVVPDTVTSIGARAFSDCVNLTSVTLSKNLTSIGEDAFTGCARITSATIPAMAAASIDKSVLTTLHVTTGDIEDRAFANCTKLVYVTIGDGVKTIGNGAFVNCTGISAISVPDSVTNIGDSAFFGCSGLVEMTLPFVGGSADAATPSASTLFGYIFGSSSFPGAFETVQLYGTGEGESATYYIPRYLTSVTVNGEILFGAFYGCDRIEKITLTSATDLGDYAFYNNTSLTEITIPDGVESIGEMTFAYCTSLEDIDFPQSIKMVDINAMMESAWYGAQLEGIVYIGKALYDYKGIMPGNMIISVPDGIYSISEEAFYGCSGLHSITMTDSVAIIGDRAFYDCSGMLSIIIGSGVNTIGEEAFEGCSSLAKVTMPAVAIDYIPQDNLQTVSITRGAIGERSFYNCDSLISLTIGNGVTSIGTEAFRNCSNLKNINWNASYVTNFTSDSNVFRNAGSSGSGITVSFGDSVQRIPAYAFYSSETSYSPNITSVKIGNNVTRIGNYAFSNCNDLASVYINDLVAWCKINFENALANPLCNADALYLNNEIVSGGLVIPDGVTYISAYAFYNCKSFTSITIPESVTRIGNYAFQNCNNLTSVTIPESVTSIGEGALSGCSSLESITIPFVGGSAGKTSSDTYQYPFGYIFGTSSYTGGSAVIQYYYGSRTSSTTSTTYYIPSSLRNATMTGGNILYGAFYNCSMLTSITIPDSVTSIGERAFYGCTGLTEIYYTGNVEGWCGISGLGYIMSSGRTLYICGEKVEGEIIISDSVTSIVDSAFSGCSGLTSITIPNSVTSIGDSAFSGCTGLTSITIPDSVTSIGNSAFSGCSGLEAVYITDLSTWCGISFGGSSANPLSYAHNLYLNGELVTGLVIPDSVTNIGDYTFYGCTGLTSVTIPASVTSIGERAFYGCTGLTSVTIPESVTSIGDYVFSGCTGLTSVTIPDSVTSIGDYAFRGCTGLTSVTIPESVTRIGNYAFEGCSGLTSITIPDSVTSIGDSAFEDCTGLTSITIPFVGATKNGTANTHFGYIFGARSYNYNANVVPVSLKEVIITGGTSIGDYAFEDCTGLTSITIPDSVTSIGSSAFSGCNKLVEVYNKSSLDITAGSSGNGNVAYYANNVYTEEGGSWFTDTADGFRFFYDGTDGYLMGYYGEETAITLPDGFTAYDGTEVTEYAIYAYAFDGCTGLTSVAIGDGVTSIGRYAFQDCTAEIVWGEDPKITEIEYYAFSEYEGTTITIPDSVTSIGDYAFDGCTGLTSVTIGDGVTSIGRYAFQDCTGLMSVTIGNSVTNIGDYAFSGCSGLTSIYYTGDVASWCGVSGLAGVMSSGCTLYIDGKKVEGDLVIPDSVTSIGDSAFEDCTGLTSITIPDSVTRIGRAFSGCTGLTSVTIPFVGATKNGTANTYFGYIFGAWRYNDNANYVPVSLKEVIITGGTNIGDYAFSGCSGLTSVTIPDSVTSIGDYAFSGCSGLTSVTIPDSVTSIGDYAFSGCSGLTSIIVEEGNPVYHSDGNCLIETESKELVVGCNTSVIPDDGSVTSIGKRAFSGCTDLTSVTIPESVTSIGDYAFRGCTGLTSVTIPESVTSIGDYAFHGCSGLTSVTIPESVTSIGDYAFHGCSGLTSVTIPESVTSIGDYAFFGCSGLTSVTIPDSVTSIGSSAFEGCSGLTSVTIPDSVTSIGSFAFDDCSGLTSVYISDIAAWCGIDFGGSYANPLSYAHNLYLNGKLVTDLVIPDSVTSIGSYVFYSYDGLTSVTIGDSVTSIGSYAFYGCSGLTSVTIPDSVTSIGRYAFYYCSGLRSVTFENTTGWYRTSSSTATSGTSLSSSSLSSPSTAAMWLTSTYDNYYWKRNA